MSRTCSRWCNVLIIKLRIDIAHLVVCGETVYQIVHIINNDNLKKYIYILWCAVCDQACVVDTASVSTWIQNVYLPIEGAGLAIQATVSPHVLVKLYFQAFVTFGRGQLKCDGTRAKTRFRLSAKQTSPFKSAGGVSSVDYWHSRGVRISGSNAGYTMFRGSVKSTGYPLHSLVPTTLPIPRVTVCYHISTGVYYSTTYRHVIFNMP